jgi:hypothetical protein
MGRISFRKMLFMCCVAAVVLAAFPLYGIAESPEDYARPPAKEQAEKVRKRVETLRMWKLTNALDLDEKTSTLLLPVLSRNDKIRSAAEGDLRENMRDLREALKERRGGQLKTILERLDHNHKALQKINDEERAELKKILTVEQQAKFIIFQQEFDLEIRRAIAESRERRPEGPGSGRPERRFPPER